MATLTDAEKLAAARAEAEASQERIRAAQIAEAPILAAAAETTKAIQLPHAQGFLALLAGPEAAAFRDALQSHIDSSLDDIPRPLGVPGVEGTKQMAERILTSMTRGADSAQTRVTALQPAPEPVAEPAPT